MDWVIFVTYYLSTFNISDFIMDNDYLSSTPPKTSAKVDILLLVYILFLVPINMVLFHVGSLYYW